MLLDENRPKILKICRVYAWNRADQDDLYQEILFQIWRSLPSLQEEGYAGTWLYRVALNAALSFVRKKTSRGAAQTLRPNIQYIIQPTAKPTSKTPSSSASKPALAFN